MSAGFELHDILFERIETGSSRPDWADGAKPLDRHAIIYISKGEWAAEVNGQAGKLPKESLHYFVPGTVLTIGHLQDEGQPYEICWLTFDMFRLASQSDNSRSYNLETGFPLEGQLRLSASHFNRCYYFLSSYQNESARLQSRFMREQYLRDLLEAVLEHAAPLPMNAIEDRMKQTVNYMLSHYKEEIRIETLAQIAELHPSYYSQLFKREMGKSPVSFLAQLRMNKAKEMLLQTEKPIREIAADVGFRDEFYFSRRFKETCGYSPTVFTQKQDLRVVSLSYPLTDHLLTLGIQPSAAQVHAFLKLNVQALKLPMHKSELWDIGRQPFLDAKPDLILCKDNVHQKAMENINDIAPILSIPWTSKDVYSHLADIARLVHREQAASEWLEQHEEKAERLRGKLLRKMGRLTVAVCSVREKGLRMYSMRNIGHVFYRSLQCSPPDKIRTLLEQSSGGAGFNWIAAHPDEILDYEADVLIVATETEMDRSRVRHWIKSNPSWMKHPAVRNGQVHVVDWHKWIVYAPYMLDRQLEEAERLLLNSMSLPESI